LPPSDAQPVKTRVAASAKRWFRMCAPKFIRLTPYLIWADDKNLGAATRQLRCGSFLDAILEWREIGG
jgi:hypothetical protein